ncbi:hypothetical protein [Azospirillum sp.]|uniref:hypothetical protein n=1 Tax=Azospirillum sp. TaxID=34012 RepID=UPI002604150A|nr:hypothetical protein [Azospirillum sp.]
MVATLRSSSPALRRPLRMLALALVLLGMSALGRPAIAETEPGLTMAPASEAAAAPATEPTAAPSPAPAPPAGPISVKTGLFITQLYDFDMAKRSFTATFWAWFLHNDEKYNPTQTVEITNAKTATAKFAGLDASKGVNWQQAKYNAMIQEAWDTTHFPFDRQELSIILEDAQSDVSAVKLVADAANSKIDSSVEVPGWTIEGLRVRDVDVTYNTSYGDPTLQGTSAYSRVVATITMKRHGLRLLLSTFIGFGVAFLLSMLTFPLSFEAMGGSRIGLCAAAVFAAIGNKYVVDNMLPPASSFTLADGIQATSFAAIFLAAFTVVVMQSLHKSSPRLSRLFNSAMGLGTLAFYVGVNGWLILRAAAS